MATWKNPEAQPLSAGSLRALFDNEIPAIRIPDFANAAECRAFADAMRQCDLHVVKGATDHSAPAFDAQQIAFIGLTQYEFKYRPMQDYLDASARATAEVAPVFERSFNPVERLTGLLRATVGNGIAIGRDPSGAPYSHTMIRKANDGLALHADYAPYQAPQLSVAEANAQLAWNFYAEVPDAEGGHTTIYNSPWTWTRARDGEVAENYPLDRALVDGAESFTFHPREGEVVIFNSRNPHEVVPVAEPGDKDRITLATFIARMPDGDLHLWS